MYHFSGNLEADSPSCTRSLTKNFDPAFVNEVKNLYTKLSLSSSLVEPAAKFRNPEVRFNPRPARIIHILINEADYRDHSGILEAVKMCFQQDSLILDNQIQVRQIKIDTVSLASFLDELRHLHMNRNFQEEIVNFTIQQIENLRVDKYLEVNQRLTLLIEAYEQRLKRKAVAGSV